MHLINQQRRTDMSIEDDQADVMIQHNEVLKRHPDADYDTFWFYIDQFNEMYNDDNSTVKQLRDVLDLASSELEEIDD